MKSEQSHQKEADRIEEEFVQAQSKDFGPDFEKIYGQLSKIYRKFGIEPFRILTRYSIDWLEVHYFGKEVGIWLEEINEEIGKLRLYRCLEIFSSMRDLPEAHEWTQDDWEHFFESWLVDFRRWRAGRQDLHRFLIKDFALCQGEGGDSTSLGKGRGCG